MPSSDYLDNPEMKAVGKTFSRIEKQNYFDMKLPARQVLKNMWIVKPENENRGKGIEIVSTLKELTDHVMSKTKETIIVQKYIERPMLFYGRKFDIRVLALIDGKKNFFRYKPCYLRTSSNEYTLANKDKYIHLTNNCY